MFITLSILCAALGIGLWVIWRLKRSGVHDTGPGILPNRQMTEFQRHPPSQPLESIDDPKVAASAIMACFARMNGPFNEDHLVSIATENAMTFGMTETTALDLAQYGYELSLMTPPEAAVQELGKALYGKLVTFEIEQLIDMIERVIAVSENSGQPDLQHQINKLRDTLQQPV